MGERFTNFFITDPSEREFPYEGKFVRGRRVFLGKNKIVRGYVDRTKTDVSLGEGEVKFALPAKTSYLEINFFAKDARVTDGKARKVVETLRRGAEDLLDFSDALENNKKLQPIDIIVGVTNPGMARIAVNRFGFHYSDPKVFKGTKKQREDGVVVFITRSELFDQRENIKSTKQRLDNFKK